jgi:hypothetical protein
VVKIELDSDAWESNGCKLSSHHKVLLLHHFDVTLGCQCWEWFNPLITHVSELLESKVASGELIPIGHLTQGGVYLSQSHQLEQSFLHSPTTGWIVALHINSRGPCWNPSCLQKQYPEFSIQGMNVVVYYLVHSGDNNAWLQLEMNVIVLPHSAMKLLFKYALRFWVEVHALPDVSESNRVFQGLLSQLAPGELVQPALKDGWWPGQSRVCERKTVVAYYNSSTHACAQPKGLPLPAGDNVFIHFVKKAIVVLSFALQVVDCSVIASKFG